MKICSALMLSLVVMMVGCGPESRSPDAIRRDSAAVTTAAVRDGKAVAKGVFDGLKAKGPVNINKASTKELEGLPGIDEAAARRILGGRPYENGSDLMKRRLVTKAEYDRIASQIVAR